MALTIVDYILLIAFAAGLIFGVWKGFVKQIFALVGVVVVAVGTTYVSPMVCGWLQSVIAAEGTRNIVAMAATFVVLLVVYGIITKAISKAINKSNTLGWINRLLGAVFGILVVYLIGSVIVSLVVSTSDGFLAGIKNMVEAPMRESVLVEKVYGGWDAPERNFFGNWLMKTLMDKIAEIMPQIPTPQG